jgi:hypothetical protein
LEPKRKTGALQPRPGERNSKRRDEILQVAAAVFAAKGFEETTIREIGGVSRIVSGGQAGADRAALDWAIARGLPHGGWCPKDRLAEDGPLDPRYQLTETESPGYRQRTRANVRDSDGTLIVNLGELDGGTLETKRYADKIGKPVFLVQADRDLPAYVVAAFARWLERSAIATLNVAGPRESKRPGIYVVTYDLLEMSWAAGRL